MAASLPRATSGMILGKFMPPHRGHQYLADFARQCVERLTILVCSIQREPIPGHLRFAWMRAQFPDCNVVHVAEEVPQEPSEHPDFWNIWREVIRRAMPMGFPDLVFASEPYGWKLAEILGAEFVPVDFARELVSVSGTAIRQDPMGQWDFLIPAARPYFLRRVCVFGPESTGKSTLARDLARHYQTAYAAEYARPFLDPKGGQCDREDIPRIARGQIASEEALALQARRVLFCDTDPLTTTIWSEVLFGDCPAWIQAEAERRSYDLYLLMDVDVPWVDDSQRYFPDDLRRRDFFERCRRTLEERGRPFVVIRGSWDERFAMACRAVDELLARPVGLEGRPIRKAKI
jgi:HTH-type transcriptional repressor of NAD biosynthesis genes